jgi:hypothetical protein
MILAEINKTELECQRVNTGLTIIMRRGQMSITMIVSPDSLESIIRELGNQLSIIRAFNDLGLDRREIRKIANNVKDKNNHDL